MVDLSEKTDVELVFEVVELDTSGEDPVLAMEYWSEMFIRGIDTINTIEEFFIDKDGNRIYYNE